MCAWALLFCGLLLADVVVGLQRGIFSAASETLLQISGTLLTVFVCHTGLEPGLADPPDRLCHTGLQPQTSRDRVPGKSATDMCGPRLGQVVGVPLDVLRFKAACQAVGGRVASRLAASSDDTVLTQTRHARGWLAKARYAYRAGRWWPSTNSPIMGTPLGVATTKLAPTSSTSGSSAVSDLNSL